MIISRSVHVATNDISSFFLLAEYYSVVYIYHLFFIHSSLDGHLGCFRVLAAVNRAAMNIGVHPFVPCFSLCVCPGVGL